MNKYFTDHVFMVRPAHFGYNEETAENNAFQNKDEDRDQNKTILKAKQEFDSMVYQLRDHKIYVDVWDDHAGVVKPDAVFPNNWISFHLGGKLITWPMYAENRRIERDPKIIEHFETVYDVKKRYEFESFEEQNIFLEGTGSLVLDREKKVAYACGSPRTDISIFDKFCVLMGYEPVYFTATDENGQDIYHTNVLMAMGHNYVVICLDAITKQADKENILAAFEATGKEVLDISHAQMNQFAGNMLQLKNVTDEYILVMSGSAYASLNPDQVEFLKKRTKILVPKIPTIETIGGGSVRCMIAEVFLTRK